jgi:hypothetical protein
MRVAIRTGSTFGRALVEDGKLVGDHSGLAIVRRLLKLFPDPILYGWDGMSEQPWDCDGFQVVHPSRIDVNDTVIINMDVVDSVALYRQLRGGTWRLYPKIVNLVWWNVSEWTDKVERQELALSTGLFYTFCNSRRTELEVRSLHARHLTPAMQARAVVESQNLGFPQPDLEPGPKHADPPIVLYPAMWLFARKAPDRFAKVVTRTAERTPIEMLMRLHPKAFPHPVIEELSSQPWADIDEIGPKDAYWANLAAATAFLATATDESYGLQYLEALWMGVIGVFPRRPWAENILPPGYPFLYGDLHEGEAMLHLAVTQPAEAWDMVAKAFDGDVRRWLRSFHSEDDFDSEFQLFLENRFPDLIGDDE